MTSTLVIFGHEVPRPLQRHIVISLTTFTIFLAAFLLFLLVGLSLTVTPSVYLIEVTALGSAEPLSNGARSLYFGVWGICATNTFEPDPAQGVCYGPQLGYTIPTSFLNEVGLSTELADVAETSLLLLLSLHLVAAGVSTTIFLLSLFLHSHAVAIIALVFAIVAAIVGSVVFAADVALVVEVRNNVNTLFSGADFNVQFGNGVWMILAAVVLTWVAVVILSARACYCCGVRRPKLPPSDASIIGLAL